LRSDYADHGIETPERTASETVQQELGASEARRRDLRAALDRLAQADAFRASAADLAQKLGTILGDWTDITRKPVAQQRQLLRKLVPDRLTVTPHVDAKRKWIDWAGDLAVAPIISGIAPAVGDVMPDDPMDGRWWPQGDYYTENDALILSLQGLVAA
jgi:hypothetical protein